MKILKCSICLRKLPEENLYTVLAPDGRVINNVCETCRNVLTRALRDVIKERRNAFKKDRIEIEENNENHKKGQ